MPGSLGVPGCRQAGRVRPPPKVTATCRQARRTIADPTPKEPDMRTLVLAAVIALALPAVHAAPVPQDAAQHAQPPYLAAAINDPGRQADRTDDARRKIAQVMAFAEVKPGDKVLELIPGSGYFTRVFSGVVGAKGHVYALWPNEYAAEAQSDVANLRKLARQPHY